MSKLLQNAPSGFKQLLIPPHMQPLIPLNSLKSSKQVQIAPNRSKQLNSVQMHQNGSKLIQIDKDGSKWIQIGPTGSKWIQMGQNRFNWVQKGLYGFKQVQTKWVQKVQTSTKQAKMVFFFFSTLVRNCQKKKNAKNHTRTAQSWSLVV